jgi:Xaa-Pro aminopeptidase
MSVTGDPKLAQLLNAAGSALDVDRVAALIEGVLAAPAEIGDSWHALVAEPTPPELAEALDALKAQLAAGRSDGVQPEDFARLPRAERLMLLREKMAAADGLAGFIIPRADEHQGEYVPLCGQRLAWLTGFTGSAGIAVVLRERAAIFVDGRYTLQAGAQVDAKAFEIHHLIDEPPANWLANAAGRGDVIGYDPWLHTPQEVERLRGGIERAGASLRAVDRNPLDEAWAGRPAAPLAPVFPQPETFAGESAADKRARVAKSLADDGAVATVLTMPESIAWLLNIRGGDVPHTPLPLSFAIVKADGGVTLFIDRRKLLPGLDRHLGNAVAIEAPDRLGPAIDVLAKEGRVQVDPATAASWVFDRLGAAGAQIHRAVDPCLLLKACKNAVELDGTREAHRRDGAAVTRFLAWLAREAPKGNLREIVASDRLEAFRKEGKYFRDLSFPTISGAGSNGAIVHYRASPETEKRLEPGTLYLLDSGAQYLDGTTDITRTIAIGNPSDEMRENFTRVLKGHIALATARFPKGTTGSQLDGFARRALWQVGLDYDHGTGHGVGSYLSVHEGPQRISKAANTQPLLSGMIVSNEPGYYKTGAYGIRIENLIVVQPDEGAAEREMLCFETITLAPIDRNLVARHLLDRDEAAWLDTYHARVRATIGPLVDADTGVWLDQVTAPIS